MKKRKDFTAKEIENALLESLPNLTRNPPGLCYQFSLETVFGPLLISPCNSAIRTRFETVPMAAPAGAPLNTYSGKWNFECLDDASEVGRALYWIGRIAPAPEQTKRMKL